MEQQATEIGTKSRGGRGKFMRRGLLALTAGVAASIAPKWMAKPVMAANNDPILVGNTYTGTNPTILTGSVTSGFGTLRVTNDAGRAFYAVTTGSSNANAIRAEAVGGAAIYGVATTNAGIYGESINSFALLGTSTNSTGLYGSSLGSQPGVRGVSAQSVGVKGESGLNPVNNVPNGNNSAAVLGLASGGTGVEGQSTSGTAVKATSTSGPGVDATSSSHIGISGVSASSIGVYGVGSTGVFGNVTSGIGVQATATSGVALRANGRSELYGDVEVGDYEANPIVPYNLNITGELRVLGQKMAIVRDSGGDYHQFYCLESAESYFEDFGTVRLTGGSVRVNIPEDFRQFVAPERGFYVQLTPLGECRGVYAANVDVMGFEVRELGSGAPSTVDVQYRIVCRRRDVEGKRLERVDPTERRPGQRKVEKNHVVIPPGESPDVTERRRRDNVPSPPPPPPAR